MERWYCARLKNNMDGIAVTNIIAQRFKTLWPRYIVRSLVRGVLRRDVKPMMTGYVLVRFDTERDRWQAINNTRGVLRVICTAGDDPRPVPVRDDSVYELMERCGTTGIVDDLPASMRALYEIGQQLRITWGSFAQFSGTCMQVDEDRDEVVVRTQIFGKEIDVPLRHSMVERVAQ